MKQTSQEPMPKINMKKGSTIRKIQSNLDRDDEINIKQSSNIDQK